MQTLTIRSGQGDYSVEFVPSVAEVAERLCQAPRAVLIVDRVVAGLHRKELATATERLPTLLLDATEDEKTLDGVASVAAWMQQHDCDKQSSLVAIGGGIVQDVVSFTAHVYYRGLRWTCVPTTLLGMADSCIGAKCCINLGTFKNQLGAFHAPSRVFLSTPFTDTLTTQDLASGYGEILKLMLTGSRDHFERLRESVAAGGLRNPDLPRLIGDSLAVKKHVIELDEYETGPRRILNYGHTFGHALEGLTDHEIPHGLAVCWGMDLVNYLSVRRGLLADADFRQVHQFIARYLPFRLSRPLAAADLIRYAKRDKKVADGRIHLVLAEKPGSLHVVKTPFDARLEEHVNDYVTHHDVYAGRPEGRQAA